MSSLTKNLIFDFNSDVIQNLRSLYGLETQESFDDAINIMIEWIKKQSHLIKQDTRREFLGKLIIFCKGSVEKAKLKYDKICTFRTILPEYFEPFDRRNLEYTYSCFLPKMVNDDFRVFIHKSYNKRYRTGLMEFYKSLIMISEYLQAYDECNNVVIVMDLMEASLEDIIKNLNIVELRTVLTIIIEGYGLRIKGLHILTGSKIVDYLVVILKQAISKKVAQRLQIHGKVDTVYDYIPKDALPLDYGGKEKSMETLSNNLLDALTSKEFLGYYDFVKQFHTNEALRSQESHSDQMGLPGTFRKLNVD